MKLLQWLLCGLLTFCLSDIFVFAHTGTQKPHEHHHKQDHIKTVTALADLFAKRAGYMRQVAIIKYADKHIDAFVYDANQERGVLKRTAEDAKKFDLSQAAVLSLKQIQMDIAKQIQSYWINQWGQKITAPININPASDSLSTIREKIRQLDNEVYPLMVKAKPALSAYSQKEIEEILQKAFEDGGIKSSISTEYLVMMAFCLKNISGNTKC